MSDKKPNIIFFGNERLASGVVSKCLTLKALIAEGYSISAVVVNQKNSSGRKKRKLEIAELAKSSNIPVVVYENSQQIIDLIKSTNSEVGVLAAFGRIIKQGVIDAFEYGILNIHPSLLPLYRGSTPIESAILNGDKTTGVSLMSLAAKMDAGPVYGYCEVNLSGNESKQNLYELLSEAGAKILTSLLPGILTQDIIAAKQDESKATYCGIISVDDKQLDFSKPALDLERQIRAFLDWPGSTTVIKDVNVKVTASEVIESTPDSSEGELIVHKKYIEFATAKNSLKVNKLQPEGKKEMDIASFINGYLK